MRLTSTCHFCDMNGEIFRSFIQQGWRAQMRTGNLLTGQNYIALDKFPKAKPASLIMHADGAAEVPTTPTELSGLQAQVSQIADKLTKFPLVEIGQDVRKTLNNMNTTIESTDKLVKQLDGKVAPGFQATLDDVRRTMQSSQSILSSDAPMQQDVRRALQQMTRVWFSAKVFFCQYCQPKKAMSAIRIPLIMAEPYFFVNDFKLSSCSSSLNALM